MHHLLAQLQSRYPTSSLTSELLTIHDGNYVVRALIQIGQTTLATGMAAALDVEAAEDRAKVRAIEALGIVPPSTSLLESPLSVSGQLPSATSTALMFSETQRSQVDPEAIASPASSNPISKTATLPSPSVNFEPNLEPDPEFSSEFNIDNTRFYLSDPDADEPLEDYPLPDPEIQEESLQTSDFNAPSKPKPSRPTRNGKASVETNPVEAVTLTSDEPTDNSDVIAQTDVELRRLGWGREQGRRHLQQTYGKRSRQQLTDEELLDFLHYLESQP